MLDIYEGSIKCLAVKSLKMTLSTFFGTFSHDIKAFPVSLSLWVFLCHVCLWTSESPRAHVAKFYGQLRLTRSGLRASKFSDLKLNEIVILLVYYTIPFDFSSFWYFWGIHFQLLNLLCLAKDHWRGFSTRNAHMVHIVN